MIRKIILVGVSCFIFTAAASASIETNNSIRVNYADINVHSVQGQERLLSRVKRAAESVCGSTLRSRAGSLKQVKINKECIKDATSKAMESTGINLISSL